MAGTASSAYWVNLRASASPGGGFAGDDSTFDVYNAGETETSLSGARKIGGVYAQGWGSGGPTGTYDDGTYSAAHNFGFNSSSTLLATNMFHIGNLVVGHTYRLWLSMGVFFVAHGCGVSICKDASGTLISGGDVAGSNLLAPKLMDIAGGVHANAGDWLTNQAHLDYVAATTDLYFGRSSSGNPAYLNAIGIEDISTGAPGSTLSLMGV